MTLRWRTPFCSKKQIEYFSERLREVNETLWRQNLLEWDIHPRWQKDNITGMIDRYFKQLKRSEENEDGTNQKLSEREQRLFNSRKGARERYERAQRIIKAEQEISRIDGMDVVLGTG